MSRFLSDVRLLPDSIDVVPDAPTGLSDSHLLRRNPAIPRVKPLVEPLEDFLPRVSTIRRPISSPFLDLTELLDLLGGLTVSHRQFQTTDTVGQQGRGTCWACAGTAALEAAYARVGVHVKLSPHYLFHMAKVHENHRNNGGISSLMGFGGSSDVIKVLSQVPVPTAEHVPYIDQGPLQTLANSIPNTQMAVTAAGGGSREQIDWFEFDLRNIPLVGRWFAQYGVNKYGQKSNYTNADIKAALAAGYDVVIDCTDNINGGGHVLLIYGYNDLTQTFEIKNSQSAPGWGTLQYANDPQFTILYNNMFYITEVTPVEGHWRTMWVGRWETNHDGWYGTLVIRRHADLLSDNLMPGSSSRVSLGTWYGRDDGSTKDVVGHFVDHGRGLHSTIGDQNFELYLHTSDPYRASGRTFWGGKSFGVVMSRGNAIGAGSGFDRSEAIGLWDITHDGWRGTLRIGAQPSYVQAADSASRTTWIDPSPIAQQVNVHINFGGGNPNQAWRTRSTAASPSGPGGIGLSKAA